MEDVQAAFVVLLRVLLRSTSYTPALFCIVKLLARQILYCS